MTVFAHCLQCGWCFTTHSAHPVAPPHPNPGTGHKCAGSDKPAEQGVVR